MREVKCLVVAVEQVVAQVKVAQAQLRAIYVKEENYRQRQKHAQKSMREISLYGTRNN